MKSRKTYYYINVSWRPSARSVHCKIKLRRAVLTGARRVSAIPVLACRVGVQLRSAGPTERVTPARCFSAILRTSFGNSKTPVEIGVDSYQGRAGRDGEGMRDGVMFKGSMRMRLALFRQLGPEADPWRVKDFEGF